MVFGLFNATFEKEEFWADFRFIIQLISYKYIRFDMSENDAWCQKVHLVIYTEVKKCLTYHA